MYKRQAIGRGYTFELEKPDVRFLSQLNCHYCGMHSVNSYQPSGTNGAFVYNGIDRVDNSMGYTYDNVVPCCGHCNIAKKSRSLVEFRGWVDAIHSHLHNMDQA
jgi:hypothetical protein